MEGILEKALDELQIDKSDWVLTKFGDVAIQQKQNVNRENTDLTRYVKGEHMGSEDLHLRSWGELQDEYLGPAFIRRFDEGDILYGSRRTYLRKVVMAPFSGITSNTTFVIKANEERIEKRLLPFIMMSEGFKVTKGTVLPLSKILIQKKEKSQAPHSRKKNIGLEHINSGDFNCNSFEDSQSVKAQCNIVNVGDLCYSKLRPYLDKAFIATFEAVSTTELLIYDTKKVSKEYVLFHLHSKPFIDYVSSQGFGTKMPRVSHKIIGEYKILVPDDENEILIKMGQFLVVEGEAKLKISSSKVLQKSLINQLF
jgi:hypothetical protein